VNWVGGTTKNDSTKSGGGRDWFVNDDGTIISTLEILYWEPRSRGEERRRPRW